MEPINTVVVGYGYAGRAFHSYLVGLTPSLRLHGIVARDPKKREAAQEQRGCRTYESIEQALADRDVRLIVLATPHDTHTPLAIQALDAGKDVVTDKVMCLNRTECDAMCDAAERSGRMLTVFHNRRWDGDFATVRSLIDSGRLGEVRWLEMSWQKYGVWGGWRATLERGGGRTYDLGAHLIDQALTLFDEPVTGVFARIHRDWAEAPTESHTMITLTFDSGPTAVLDVGCTTRWAKPRFHVIGRDGTFLKFGLDPQESAMNAGDIDSAKEDPAAWGTLFTGHSRGEHDQERIPTLPGRWRSFYENVGDALNGVAPIAVTLGQMKRLMGVTDAVFESARTGQIIRPKA